jgi:hypothetical protein
MSKNDKKNTYSKRTNSSSHNNQKKEEQNESLIQNSGNNHNISNINVSGIHSSNNNSIVMNSSGMLSNSNHSDISFVKDKSEKNVHKVDCLGKIPSARFGHTMVLVSPVKAVLFGGAIGDTKNFVFSNETYILNLMTKIWLRLESNFRLLSYS